MLEAKDIDPPGIVVGRSIYDLPASGGVPAAQDSKAILRHCSGVKRSPPGLLAGTIIPTLIAPASRNAPGRFIRTMTIARDGCVASRPGTGRDCTAWP
jgi:hypothetical protein